MVLPWYFEMPWILVKNTIVCEYSTYSGQGYFSGLGKLSRVVIVYIVYIVLITIFADQYLCCLLHFCYFMNCYIFYVCFTCMFLCIQYQSADMVNKKHFLLL